MTYACFDCLPPYAAYLALSERQSFVNFQKAIKNAPFDEEILKNVTLLKWACKLEAFIHVTFDQELPYTHHHLLFLYI